MEIKELEQFQPLEKYYKLDRDGRLILVEEKYGRFCYVFPKNGDPDRLFKNPREVMNYVKERVESPLWSYYER